MSTIQPTRIWQASLHSDTSRTATSRQKRKAIPVRSVTADWPILMQVGTRSWSKTDKAVRHVVDRDRYPIKIVLTSTPSNQYDIELRMAGIITIAKGAINRHHSASG